jgi:hypothetical protein
MLSLSLIGTMCPSDFHNGPPRLRYLIRRSRRPPHHRYGSPALDDFNFRYMPTLLPRRFAGMASIINIPALRPSLYRHEVGNRIKFTRLYLGSLALRPISLSFRNSRPLITQTPLLRTTKAYGQFLERDFNPLAKSLLLRTSDPIDAKPRIPFTLHPGYSLLAASLSVKPVRRPGYPIII